MGVCGTGIVHGSVLGEGGTSASCMDRHRAGAAGDTGLLGLAPTSCVDRQLVGVTRRGLGAWDRYLYRAWSDSVRGETGTRLGRAGGPAAAASWRGVCGCV